MKYAIRYYSKSGNTKKLADSLSEYLTIPSLDISHKITEDVDILFFGTGVYGCALDPRVITFLSEISVNIGTIVNFSTSGIMESNYSLIRDIIRNTNLTLSNNEFHCPGSFVGMNADRPNNDDCDNFISFVEDFLS